MNRRIIKKIARRYLDGGNAARYVLRVSEYPDGCGGFRAMAEFRGKLQRAIYREASRRGWDGYWGDSPFLIYSEEADDDEARPGFAATCCKAARRLTC